MFRELDEQETERFKRWAFRNWQPNRKINPMWHPAVQAEWRRLDEAQLTTADGKPVRIVVAEGE